MAMHAPSRLIIATRNAHKTAEIRAMIGGDFEKGLGNIKSIVEGEKK